MDKVLHYLYDPLCGWCYGAAPAVSRLFGTPGVSIELLPTGLFSGKGKRAMDEHFAAYAWSNDQGIAHLTGQAFSDDYRRYVLGDRVQPFDSGPATMALTAVASTAPAREFEALKAIQRARYVHGGDVTSPATLAALLEALDLKQAAAWIAHPDADLVAANHARIGRAQSLMQEFGVRGVPTFIAESEEKRWVLEPSAVYATPHALINQLKAA